MGQGKRGQIDPSEERWRSPWRGGEEALGNLGNLGNPPGRGGQGKGRQGIASVWGEQEKRGTEVWGTTGRTRLVVRSV